MSPIINMSTTPWKNGYYYSKEATNSYLKVENENVEAQYMVSLDHPNVLDPMGIMTWTPGSFGPTSKEMLDVSGTEFYNMEIKGLDGFLDTNGVFDAETDTIYVAQGWAGVMEIYTYYTQEEIENITREPIDALSCPYVKNQPGKPGKLIWLSGPSASGKSTTARLLNQNHGFAYMEGDAFFVFVNPFVDPDANSMEFLTQTPLKNVPKTMIEGFVKANKEFDKINRFELDSLQWENTLDFFVEMAKMVEIQRQRIGGDFVIASGVPNQDIREAIRNVSPDVIFFNLELSKETQEARCLAQNAELSDQIIQLMVSLYDQFKGPGEDEPNTFVVNVDGKTTTKDVMDEIIKVLDDLEPKSISVPEPAEVKKLDNAEPVVKVQPKSFFSKLMCK